MGTQPSGEWGTQQAQLPRYPSRIPALQVHALCFFAAHGLSGAASTRVGNELGGSQSSVQRLIYTGPCMPLPLPCCLTRGRAHKRPLLDCPVLQGRAGRAWRGSTHRWVPVGPGAAWARGVLLRRACSGPLLPVCRQAACCIAVCCRAAACSCLLPFPPLGGLQVPTYTGNTGGGDHGLVLHDVFCRPAHDDAHAGAWVRGGGGCLSLACTWCGCRP